MPERDQRQDPRTRLHDERIARRQVGDMLQAALGLQAVLPDPDRARRARLRRRRSCLRAAALAILSLAALAALREFFF